MRQALLAAIMPYVLAGCLDPLVGDAPVADDLILPKGSVVPLAQGPIGDQLVEMDGVAGEVPLLGGYAQGDPVQFWDFGAVGDATAVPAYVLARQEGMKAFEPIEGAPMIVAALPGDPGYSPLFVLHWLPVTTKWDGEVLASFEAVSQARDLGLVKRPIKQRRIAHCPVVAPATTLEDTRKKDRVEAIKVYAHGVRTVCFPLGTHEVGEDAMQIPIGRVYTLRREGGEPLSEPERGVDINGDGDLGDTNHVFEAGPDDAGYSPLVRVIEVVIAADAAAIDTGADLGPPYRDAEELFDLEGDPPIPRDAVIAWHDTGEVRCLPQLGGE